MCFSMAVAIEGKQLLLTLICNTCVDGHLNISTFQSNIHSNYINTITVHSQIKNLVWYIFIHMHSHDKEYSKASITSLFYYKKCNVYIKDIYLSLMDFFSKNIETL